MTVPVKVLQDGVREYLAANYIKEGTKTALKAEHAYLVGASKIVSMGLDEISPAVQICMMSGRSILTLKGEDK